MISFHLNGGSESNSPLVIDSLSIAECDPIFASFYFIFFKAIEWNQVPNRIPTSLDGQK